MVFYETTYILHSALQEGRLNDIVKVIEKNVASIKIFSTKPVDNVVETSVELVSVSSGLQSTGIGP